MLTVPNLVRQLGAHAFKVDESGKERLRLNTGAGDDLVDEFVEAWDGRQSPDGRTSFCFTRLVASDVGAMWMRGEV